VSVNPFKADPAVGEQLAWLENDRGDAIRGEVGDALTNRGKADPIENMGGVLPKQAADRIAGGNGITIETLMLLSLGVANGYARPRISSFTVGAVGLESETGNLVFGGNLEFPGANIANTVHAEGFVFARAFSRGTSIKTIAIGEAHPCAFCRQFLSEFAATQALTLIDPLGHRLTMAELYPWPFDPAYLGETGLVPGTIYAPHLALGANSLAPQVAELLTDAGRRAYAPYSKCPGAVVLQLRDGNLVAGSSIESVAFNPTIAPMQAALIDLLMQGYTYAEISAAALGTVVGGAVDYTNSTAELLAAIAPEATLELVDWTDVPR